MIRRLVALLGAFSVGAFPVVAFSQDFTAGTLTVSHPWSRPVAAGVPVGVVYFVVTNRGKTDVTLIGAKTPATADVQIHQSSMSGGMARMRPLAQVVIPAGRSVSVAPGGIHLMLMDLTAPLAAGTRYPLTLIFGDGRRIVVEVAVEPGP